MPQDTPTAQDFYTDCAKLPGIPRQFGAICQR